jgi:hypothetical protein
VESGLDDTATDPGATAGEAVASGGRPGPSGHSLEAAPGTDSAGKGEAEPARQGPAAPSLVAVKTPASETTSVAVNAIPRARISVDGVEVGGTPIVALTLPKGLHRFVASFDDGHRVERLVRLEGDPLYLLFP